MLKLLVSLVLSSEDDAVAMMVPLTNDISNVDVAVTVTVRSVLVVVSENVVVLFRASEKTEPAGLSSAVELVDESSELRGVGGGVDNVSWEESVALPPTTLVVSEIPGSVKEPTFDRDTTASVVAAGTSVTFEVVVPSLTLISTTLAVTVASGALGRR